MQELIKLKGYHATDIKNVKSILLNNFRYSVNEDDWLGGGSYFFVDPTLAKKWSKKPTKKYGLIKNPAYLYVDIEAEKEYVCDLRYLNDYNLIKKYFKIYYTHILSKTRGNKIKLTKINYKKFRRAFFDWFTDEYNLKCLIAYFDERNNHLPINTKTNYEFNLLKIPYIEVQICVKNNTIITNIKEINLQGCE